MHVEVLEQPVSCGYFFQLEYQPRDWIWGNTSTVVNTSKTYPSIKIYGYTGEAVVHVSCVTKTISYRPHPCMLDGPDCTNGVYVCKVHCPSKITIVSFPKIAIMEHSQPSSIIEDALNKRKKINVDPFKTGFDHVNYAKYFIDLNAVRLCFEVYIEDEYGLYRVPLQPVVSNIVKNSRVIWSNYSFNIVELSDRKCPADGGSKDITVCCDKPIPKHTRVCFFEVAENGRITWESYSRFETYTSATIRFRPPKYRSLLITEPVRVLMQLLDERDTYSEAMPFHYLPMEWFPRRTDANAGLSPHLSLEAQTSDTEEKKASSATCTIL